MPATARVFRTYPLTPSRSNLLVQDYEQCTEGSANSSVDCPKADFCWNHMAVVHSNCRVLYVSTMSISELKKYICGKSTCAAAARIAQRKCGRTYAIDTSWLAPVFFYYDRYCSDEFHVTDLVNDHSSCELSLLDRLHGFCDRVMNCYTEAGAFARNCRLDQATMQEVQTVVESKGCADAAEHVLDLCGDYGSVRRTTTAMRQYRRFFQQSGVAALPSPPGLTPWPTNTSHFLTPAYERCTMTTDITERNSEECHKAVHCHSLLAAATTACDVIWLPSMSVSSLAEHVCGRSLCGSFAGRVEAECGHFHRARSVFGPVMSYRRKYCPDSGHTDMVNDLFVCRLTPKNSSTRPHCDAAARCQEQIARVDQRCLVLTSNLEESADNVCSAQCRSFINATLDTCAEYGAITDSLKVFQAYQNALACGSDAEAEFFSRSYSSIMVFVSATQSVAGAIAIGITLACVSIAFLAIRSLSLGGLPQRMCYVRVTSEEHVPLTSYLDGFDSDA